MTKRDPHRAWRNFVINKRTVKHEPIFLTDNRDEINRIVKRYVNREEVNDI